MYSEVQTSHNYPPISVWLSNDTPGERKPFRCLSCGKIAFEYFDDVQIIMPGTDGVQKYKVVIQCQGIIQYYDPEQGHFVRGRCKIKYHVG